MSTPNISDVIAKLPAEVYDNPTPRGLAFVARDWAIYIACIAALIAVDTWWALPILWVLTTFAISALFILGHDAAHGALFESKDLCYGIGQACMLPSLHVYEAWVLGHNRIHHGHTIKQEMDYVWHPASPQDYREMSRAQRLAHRIKWSWLGAGVYYAWDVWWKKMMSFEPPKKIADDVKRDRRIVATYAVAVSAALLAAGALSYGSLAGALWMWTKVFLVPFIGWSYMIGFAVYVHHIDPEIPWHGRADWDRFKGQMEGTTVLYMPAWSNFFFHNIFLHVPHHVDMRIPFYQLPQATRAILENFGEHVRVRRFRLRDYLRATRRCKLFDFDAGRWVGYREAVTG
jgi:omega-6 fatty acid desaturase (delta-12 desaturase)